MLRKITSKLVEWKNLEQRKPLLLTGASQVGKTHTVEVFGASYFEEVITINIELDKAFREMLSKKEPLKNRIRYIEMVAGISLCPNNTLLFFDEVQASPLAIEMMIELSEAMPTCHVIAAGRLMNTTATQQQLESVAMERVIQLELHPLDFEEFLWAIRMRSLSQTIRTRFYTDTPMSVVLHQQATELFDMYLLVGGMPEAIKCFLQEEELSLMRGTQHQIIDNYIEEIQRYTSMALGVKVEQCYTSIAKQLAKPNKKFQYNLLHPNKGSDYFKSAIEWLVQSGMATICYQTDDSDLQPTMHNFRLYLNDVGLLNLVLRKIHAKTPLGEQPPNTLAECYIAQILAVNTRVLSYHYSATGAALCFVTKHNKHAVPIYVSGTNVESSTKSIAQFIKKYDCPHGFVLSRSNFTSHKQIRCVPLYAAHCLLEPLLSVEEGITANQQVLYHQSRGKMTSTVPSHYSFGSL